MSNTKATSMAVGSCDTKEPLTAKLHTAYWGLYHWWSGDGYRLTRWFWPWAYIKRLEQQVAELDEWNDEIEDREWNAKLRGDKLQRELEREQGLTPSQHWLDLIGPRRPEWAADKFIEALTVPRLFAAKLNGEPVRCLGAVKGVSGGWWVYIEPGERLIESSDLSDLAPLAEPWTPEPPDKIKLDCMVWKWWAAPNPFTGEEAEGVRLNREAEAKRLDAEIPW